MRVAFIDQSGDSQGGAQHSLALLLENLPEPIQPLVITFKDGAFAEKLRAKNIAVHVVPLGDSSSTSTRERLNPRALAEVPACAVRMARILRQERVDLVYTNTVKAHIVGALAARLASLPMISHLRDVLHGLGRKVVRTALALGSAQRIAVSSLVKNSFALGETAVIENPVDLVRYRDLPSRDEARIALGLPIGDVPIMGIVGRINRWKGHDRFLRALAEVNREHPVYGAIVGAPVFRDADFLPELHALAAELGIIDRLFFIDWVEDVRQVYAALDVHVNASYQEPFGRTMIEAAAAGVPSVLFDDSGVAEFFDDGNVGYLAPAGDVKQFTAYLRTYAANAALRSQHGAAAKLWANKFDAVRHANKVSKYILAVHEKYGRRSAA
jgi:glycosyltransferase involved in cell wall biosynthesis